MMKLLQKALRPGATALVAMMLLGLFAPALHAAVPDPSNSTFVAPTTSVPADGTTQLSFTVNVLDASSQPVSGAMVGINSGVNAPQGLVVTQVNGGVTDVGGNALFVVQSSTVGQATFTATVNGQTITGNPSSVTIDFTAPLISVANSDFALSAITAVANGVDAVTATVTVRDANNQLVVGQDMKLHLTNAVDLSQVNVTPGMIVTTDAQGQAQFTLTSTLAQDVLVGVYPVGAFQQMLGMQFVTFTPAPVVVADPNFSDIGVSPTVVSANGVAQAVVDVSVYDTNNQPMALQTVTLTPVSNPAAGLSFPTTATTDGMGIASFPITSTEVTQQAFTVSVGNVVLGTTAMIDFIAPVADPNSSVTVAPSSIPADGVTPAVVQVVLVDAGGIAIPNQLIDVSYDLNGANTHLFATTALDGTAAVHIISGAVGTVTLDVVANGVLLNTHPIIDFTPAPIDLVASQVLVQPQTVPGDNTSPATVTVYLVDTNGQPVSGQKVTITMNIGLYQVNAPGVIMTDPMGLASASFTYGYGGQAVFSVTVNGQTLNQTATATFVASASKAQSKVTASPAMVPADAVTPSMVMVHAQNSSALPIANQLVTLTPDVNAPAGLDIQASNGGFTDANGDITFTVTSPNGGDATFTATVDNGLVPVVINQTATVTFIGVLPPVTIDVANSKVDPQPNTLPADGVTQSLVTVTLTDANTNMPAAGQVVNLSDVNGLSGVVIAAQNAGVTDGNGQAFFVITGTTIGQSVLAATVNGTTLNKVTLDFVQVPPDPSASQVSVYPTSLLLNTGNPAIMTVHLVDQFGNLVTNYPVDFVLKSAPAGMNVTVLPAMTVLSDAQGVATFTITADALGTFDVGASANGQGIGASVAITVQTLHQGNSNITVSPNTQPADGTSIVLLTVSAKDAQGAPIVGQPIVLNGGGQGVTVSGSNITDVNGDAIYKITSTNAGTVSFTAQMGSTLFSQTANVTFTSTGQSGQIGGSGSSAGSSGGGGGNFSVSPAPVVPTPQVLGAHTGELVKIASNTAVYFVATDGKRHAFPNEKVYFTWYQNFDDVVTISDAEMASIPLGSNVTYRPGTRMVKFESLANVYVVGKGGELRWVTSEALAASLYGANWAKMVDDVSDAFYVNYHFGADVTDITGFNPAAETSAVPTIEQNL
jgi:adhesin/invasin